MSMPDEAMTSMPPPASIIPKPEPEFHIVNKTPSVIDPKTGQTKRGRGRPPGAKNRVKPPDGGINPPMKMSPGSPSRQPSGSDPVDNKEAKKEQKKLRAEQYSKYINEELNDKLFMLLIGASNGAIKPEMLYKEGRVPPKAAGNPNLSELGNAIAIPADVADSWGKLIAELTETDAGKNLMKATDNHTLVVIMAAVTAVFSTYRYSQTLKPYIKLIQQVQANAKGDSNDLSE